MKTYYVIAYDVRDDRRRLQLARVLLAYGHRVQFSVFEAYLTRADFLQMLAALQAVIDDEEDRVAIYPLLEPCRRKILRLGVPLPVDPEEETWVV